MNQAATRPHQTLSLRVCDLSCVRDDRLLLDRLSFEVQDGQIGLIEGRNGSGKTTLLRILCGMRFADSGDILWGGQSAPRLGSIFLNQVAYVGHHDGIKRELTALENLQLAQLLSRANGVAAQDALQEIGLRGFEDVPCRNLSAGQRRRVALARLLITHHPLWILDEPFTSLDRDGIALFEGIMARHIAAGGMVVMTAHHDLSLNSANVRRINLSS